MNGRGITEYLGDDGEVGPFVVFAFVCLAGFLFLEVVGVESQKFIQSQFGHNIKPIVEHILYSHPSFWLHNQSHHYKMFSLD
jgi:hypothetical protein